MPNLKIVCIYNFSSFPHVVLHARVIDFFN